MRASFFLRGYFLLADPHDTVSLPLPRLCPVAVAVIVAAAAAVLVHITLAPFGTALPFRGQIT